MVVSTFPINLLSLSMHSPSNKIQSQGIISPSFNDKISPGTKSIFLTLLYPFVFCSFKYFLFTLYSINPSKERSFPNFLINFIYLNINFIINIDIANKYRRHPNSVKLQYKHKYPNNLSQSTI